MNKLDLENINEANILLEKLKKDLSKLDEKGKYDDEYQKMAFIFEYTKLYIKTILNNEQY